MAFSYRLHGARARGYGIASSNCLFAGPMSPPYRCQRGRAAPFYGALSRPLEISLVRKHSSCRRRGPVFADPGAFGRISPRMIHPSTEAVPCGSLRLRTVPFRAGGLAGISCEFHRRPLVAPAEWDSGASFSGSVKGVRFRCREPARPSISLFPSAREITGAAPGHLLPFSRWVCESIQRHSLGWLSTRCFTCGLYTLFGARSGGGPISTI